MRLTATIQQYSVLRMCNNNLKLNRFMTNGTRNFFSYSSCSQSSAVNKGLLNKELKSNYSFELLGRQKCFSLDHRLSKNWYSVTYMKSDGEKTTVKGKDGDNLLDIAINNSVDLEGFGACEGTLSCSTCHLIFKKEDFDKISDPACDEELDMLDLAAGLTETPNVKCISFAGCGFLSLYLVGAASCLQKHYPNIFDKISLCGASAGALLAACLACKVPLETLKENVLDTAFEAHLWSLGPFSPAFKIEEFLRKGLSHLPPDAHLIAQDRLFVSLTRPRDFSNVTVSSWTSREDLIQSLICSCFIPIFSGRKAPRFRGEPFIDGGFSNNLPIVGNPSLTVSPFAGGASISPKDHYKNPRMIKNGDDVVAVTPKNFVRLIRALLPPPIEDLERLYQEGFRQTEQFLRKSFTSSHNSRLLIKT